MFLRPKPKLAIIALRYPGMSEVMDPATLSVLSAREFQRLIGGDGAGSGADDEWGYAKIMASVVCKHGYTVESSQVTYCFQMKWKEACVC